MMDPARPEKTSRARRSAAMNEAPGQAIYHARLTETGLAIDDSIALCAEYAATGDWGQVTFKALQENLLGKGSRSRISKLLRAVERRILHPRRPLDHPNAIARFLSAESRVTKATKAQLVFVLAVSDDLALADAFRTLVLPVVTGTGARALRDDEILNFLAHAAEIRPEVARWSEQTRAR